MRGPSPGTSLFSSSTPGTTAAVSDEESGMLDATKSNGLNDSNSSGYGSIPGGEGGGEKAVVGAGGEGGAWWRCRMPSVPDMLIYGGFLLNMSTKGTIACFETLGAEYSTTHFGMTSAEAGSTFATFGTIGVVRFLFCIL